MGIISLLEINHDYLTGRTQEEKLRWVERMDMFLSSGDARHLPTGVTLFDTRHHPTDCPIEK